MPHPLAEVLIVAAAYLLGSLSFATILVRLFRGVDVREQGSGNAGATNVLRTAGKPLAAATMLLDLAKGTAAVLLMRLATYDPRWAAAAAVAAIVGHVFPIYFGFRGGKGVATAIGGFLALSPAAVGIVVIVFLVVVFLTRYVSLGSVTAACVLPLSLRLLSAPDAYVVAGALTAGVILFSHRGNIRRLLDGTERRIREKETR
jgi:glycerol-3-phosphate acyltransferase PlsY